MKKTFSGEEKCFDNTGLGCSIDFSNSLPVANHDDNPWCWRSERFAG
ncbi:MAG: hypothetical protein OXK19_00725 [Candidatus Dadabacteria bacterium]|nr:hypothetical protein [Candidatus Dadabacteria bacterium]